MWLGVTIGLVSGSPWYDKGIIQAEAEEGGWDYIICRNWKTYS